MTVAVSELDALVRREHTNPHAVLGPHPDGAGVVIRAMRPAACGITARLDDGTEIELDQVHAGGVFEGVADDATLPLRYQLEVDYGTSGRFTIDDPYAFSPTLGELDLYLISEGRHEQLYDKLGAHIREHKGVTGTAFSVWAPAARAVSVVGDFNSWDGRLHAMRTLGSAGIWELFLPGVEAGAHYKYEILGADGELRLKADPFAQEAELRPRRRRSSRSPGTSGRARTSSGWTGGPGREPLCAPMSIYEVHLGSWRLNSARGQPPAHLPRARRRAVGLRDATWASPTSSCCR